MSKLSDKEIEYFRELLPDGVAIVDFRGIENRMDFVKRYLPKDFEDGLIPHSSKIEKAIDGFIKQVKKK